MSADDWVDPSDHEQDRDRWNSEENTAAAMLTERASAAIDSLATTHVVSVSVDGSRMLAWLEVIEEEHLRRQRLDVGAMTSTGLLHGLWMLPSGVPVRADALPPEKVERLRRASYAAVETSRGFERVYSPPGVVRAVAFAGRRAQSLVQRAIRFTPIVQRFAVVVDSPRSVSTRVESVAREWGIGVIEVTGQQSRCIVDADPPVRGVPSVFRWWIAEVAYAALLYENTQLFS